MGNDLEAAPQPAGGDYVTVPRVPTEAMWDGLARAIVMWMDMGDKTPRALFKHLDRSGIAAPQWLRDELEMRALDHVPSKGTRAVLVYRAMLSDAPMPTPTEKPLDAPAVQGERYLSGRFTWAAPGDQQEDVWLLRFCDTDMREAIFTGPDAEAEAWGAWNKYAPAWNCYVFRLAALTAPVEPQPANMHGYALANGEGWVAFNPDTGEEYSPNHPVESGECVEATGIRQSTPQEDALWAGMQKQFQRAETLFEPHPLDAKTIEAVAAMFDKAADEINAMRDRSPFHSVSDNALNTYAVNLKGWAQQIHDMLPAAIRALSAAPAVGEG